MNHNLCGPVSRNQNFESSRDNFERLLGFCFIDKYIQRFININDMMFMSFCSSFGEKIMDIVNNAFKN